MEYDTILKHFLINDPKINSLQCKYSLDYLQCKVKNCYSSKFSSETSEQKIVVNNHDSYEACKKICISRLENFISFKHEIYKEFNWFYYQKFYECSQILEEDKYNICIYERKNMMKESIDNIKNIFEEYI